MNGDEYDDDSTKLSDKDFEALEEFEKLTEEEWAAELFANTTLHFDSIVQVYAFCGKSFGPIFINIGGGVCLPLNLDFTPDLGGP